MIHWRTTADKPRHTERTRRAADDLGWLRMIDVLEARCPRGHRGARLQLPDVPSAPIGDRIALGEWSTREYRCRCRLVLLPPADMVPFLASALRKHRRAGLPIVKLGADQVREPVPEELDMYVRGVLEPAAGQGSPFDPAKMRAAERARAGEGTARDEAAARRRWRIAQERFPDPGGGS